MRQAEARRHEEAVSIPPPRPERDPWDQPGRPPTPPQSVTPPLEALKRDLEDLKRKEEMGTLEVENRTGFFF